MDYYIYKGMAEPEIMFENKNFLAINKPAGLMMHAAKISQNKKKGREREEGPEPTLVDWLIKNYPEVKGVGDDPVLRPGIVHRLDKETSGIMLIPKTQAYFEYLKALFQKREMEKTYYALVTGVPKKEKGTIDAPIGIRSGTLKRSTHSTKMQKEAVTEYKVLKVFKKSSDGRPSPSGLQFSLLEIKPKTGRTHQIRVHLASIGHAIVGDRLYGPKSRPAWASRLMLHAKSIRFAQKEGAAITLEADLPAEFKNL